MYQDRYDFVEDKVLYREYEMFLNNCKRKNLSISKQLEDRDGGFNAFKERALECDYRIGMKPEYNEYENGLVVNPSLIDFVSRDTIYIPFQKKPSGDRSKGRNPGRRIDNIQNIEGFGIKLNLLGWSKFCSMNLMQLKELIESGKRIEDIYSPIHHNQGKGRVRIIRFNGVEMSTSEACNKALISRADFERRVHGLSDEQRQSIFDTLVNETPHDYRCFCNRYWVLVNDDDFIALSTNQRMTGESFPQMISRLIKSAKEKRDNAN